MFITVTGVSGQTYLSDPLQTNNEGEDCILWGALKKFFTLIILEVVGHMQRRQVSYRYNIFMMEDPTAQLHQDIALRVYGGLIHRVMVLKTPCHLKGPNIPPIYILCRHSVRSALCSQCSQYAEAYPPIYIRDINSFWMHN